MKRIIVHFFIVIVVGSYILSCSRRHDETAQRRQVFTLSYSGAMRNVMHKGELFCTIVLDTISDRQHLYGVGPLEYLKGEILILDGVTYVSKVISETQMEVREESGSKAPFLVYARVPLWKEIPLPDTIITLKNLEEYLNTTVTDLPRPFPFLVTGTVQSATIHVQNLPEGTVVQSPDDARQGQILYTIPARTSVTLVGFFSTEHQGIFTHRDSYVHVHLLTDDKKMMGHVDSLEMELNKSGVTKLFLPGSEQK